MSTSMDLFYKELVLVLGDESTRPVGLVNPPSSTPEVPYGIVYPEDKRRNQDGLDFKHVDVFFSVQSVGRLPEQVMWMSDKFEEILTDEGILIIVPNVSITWRLLERGGAIMPSGDDLFIGSDDYNVRFEHA